MSGMPEVTLRDQTLEKILPEDAFSRMDEMDDRVFYEKDRFVEHLDSLALSTVEKITGDLIVEESPVILDLMAGWDSHIPPRVRPSRVVGLGLNANELEENKALTEVVLHDLNANPRLPFDENTFDVVLNTVSVDYMTRPYDVFRDVARILKPGGLFLVLFSNRMFPQKAVKLWKESGEKDRITLVEDFFRASHAFEKPKVFLSKGRPRPGDDKYAHLGIPSDPVYAVYGEKRAEEGMKKSRPELHVAACGEMAGGNLQARMKTIKDNLCCPHCGQRMKKWAVPQSPFCTWDAEFMYICFHDECPYLQRGWEVMGKQGNMGLSYRFMYDPVRDASLTVPVPTLDALKESIVEEGDEF